VWNKLQVDASPANGTPRQSSVESRMARRGVLLGLLSSLGVGSAMVACSNSRLVAADKGETPMVWLNDFNISSDGRIVVFQFSHGPSTPSGLGLYEWRTGAVTRIPNPPGKQLYGASFSYDGKRLAAVLFEHGNEGSLRNIAVVDLTTMATTQITQPTHLTSYVVYPVFQPGTDRLLYAENLFPYPTGLKLVGISDRREETIIPQKEGFFRIFRPSFVAQSEIYFPAINPFNQSLKAELSQAGLSGVELNYRLQFGGVPERLFPHLDELKTRPGFGYDSLSASRDGATVIALGLNLGAPFKPNGAFNDEVFRIHHDGQPVQLTSLFGFLGYCRVSYDGSTVCFGSRAAREAPTELNILDLTTNRVIETDLRRQIEGRSDFTN
jgi:hypothetical protein